MRQSIRIGLPDNRELQFSGREAWTLRHLIKAGSKGVTTLDQPAPRWSHYIYKLRRAGLLITTDYERHSGQFPGTHGRYRLKTKVQLVERSAV